MKYPLVRRRAVLLTVSCALLPHAGLALAAQGEEAALIARMRPAMSALTPQPNGAALAGASVGTPSALDPTDSTSDAQGNVAELMQMIHDAKLSELRTTYNGSYGTSLFFYPQEVTYYVALFQDKHFWRVIKSENVERAEAVYAGFAQQTAQLADAEIRGLQLQAQKAFLEDIIATSQDRAKRLQADLTVARTQQARVDDYQRQTQGKTVTLRAEKERAQAQLLAVQNQVMQLQKQTEFGLPTQSGLPVQGGLSNRN